MVAIFFAEGFEEIEALTPADVLRRAGLEVLLVGVGSRMVWGAHGICIACDLTIEELEGLALEMAVLPGGQHGAENLGRSRGVRACVEACAANEIWIGAICAAPSVLGGWGLLAGRRVTCFPGYEDRLGGGVYTGAPVETDGRLITARGAGVALDFSLKLVEALKGREAADKLFAAMQCR